MRTTVKELKKWLENVSDDAIISINTYANNHEKSFIIATEWDESGKSKENEFVVSVEDGEFPIE